jgi:hypothetical protein
VARRNRGGVHAPVGAPAQTLVVEDELRVVGQRAKGPAQVALVENRAAVDHDERAPLPFPVDEEPGAIDSPRCRSS